MDMEFKESFEEEFGESGSVLPELQEDSRPELVNLQMILVTSSMNHEYARKAYESCKIYSRQQELLVRMSHLKNLYFVTRKKLAETYPDRLQAIEEELQFQKQAVFSDYLV